MRFGLYTESMMTQSRLRVENTLLAILALQCSVTWFVNHYKGTSMSIPVGRVMMECVVEALVPNTLTILPVVRKKT